MGRWGEIGLTAQLIVCSTEKVEKIGNMIAIMLQSAYTHLLSPYPLTLMLVVGSKPATSVVQALALHPPSPPLPLSPSPSAVSSRMPE